MRVFPFTVYLARIQCEVAVWKPFDCALTRSYYISSTVCVPSTSPHSPSRRERFRRIWASRERKNASTRAQFRPFNWISHQHHVQKAQTGEQFCDIY
ncbi:unnamed protein product, partial [Ixodes pacificus]